MCVYALRSPLFSASLSYNIPFNILPSCKHLRPRAMAQAKVPSLSAHTIFLHCFTLAHLHLGHGSDGGVCFVLCLHTTLRSHYVMNTHTHTRTHTHTQIHTRKITCIHTHVPSPRSWLKWRFSWVRRSSPKTLRSKLSTTGQVRRV